MKNNSQKTKKVRKQRKGFVSANTLTLFRLILIIPMIFLTGATYYYHGWSGSTDFGWAFFGLNLAIALLFGLAMATDYFDGKIARQTNTVSKWGKIWDQTADKLMTNLVLIYAASVEIVPFWLTALFILRDITVSSLRATASSNGQVIAANKLGKIKTLLLSIGILIALILVPLLAKISSNFQSGIRYWVLIVDAPIIAAGVLAVISGIQYYIISRGYIKVVDKK
ncbi:CDP-diacylglycerol--glycerol-3-phosphate 3-phosphatidyltransferase [Mycoplasma sp. Pen4]|uniref:CDP-diacylglycerol--glycerol-3-phosphate 3-phosphatidyltransferase n=1 Tax=Mycoplasma sp. Pen4 TaxID=640330 RepID=UPI0016546B5E|nr:CDP-diacylglycerol--glycerol-3-phosphate 3-phosphatidyltransferase [Mycoplasma sp. Pen4]QNM93887.1 CDP-diacylglycerol--glycerol-3-phosphate 3-phosphatidyltransferase [Mycoplasma sp. Pen4]